MKDSSESCGGPRVASELELLTRRVERLEKSNRLMKIAGLVAAVSIVAIAHVPILSASIPGIVTATEYELVSGTGAMLAALGRDSHGFARLAYFDANGHQAISVGMGPTSSEAGLAVFDGNSLIAGKGITRGQWGISNPSAPAERFIDANGFGRALIQGKGADGGWALVFYDPAGKRLVQAGESDDGKGAGLLGFDGNKLLPGKGVQRAALGIGATGAGEAEYDGNGVLRVATTIAADSSSDGLFLFDANKVLRATINENPSNPSTQSPFLVALNDAAGKTRAFIGENTGGPFLGATDANGKAGGFVSENATGVGFDVKDANGVGRASVRADATGANIGVNDVNGKPRAIVFAHNTDYAGLALFNATSLTNPMVGLLEGINGGNAFIFFNNAAGKSIGSWFPPAPPSP